METKQPGYYRMLLENIEQGATETISEDKAQLMATTQAIKADLSRQGAGQQGHQRDHALGAGSAQLHG
jgi:hypothetical protein